MEKPTQCYDCRLISSDGLYCRLTHNNVDWSKVNPDCPLIEIPAAKAGPWIPVSKRLPEVGYACIVTGKQKYSWEKEWKYFVDVAYSGYDYIDDYWDTFNDWIEGQETHIIAWMSLPEPWKGE